MKPFIRKHWHIIILTILGSMGGFLHWRLIGCQSGSCPLTSHWYTSSVLGGIMGYLAGSILFDLLRKGQPYK